MKIRADRRIGILLGGVILTTFVALGATVALPASDPSLKVDQAAELDEQAERGREIFRREGLWRCDVSYQRETTADGEGATTPADIDGQNPALLGVEVVGRSWESCGTKLTEDDTAAVNAFLATRAGE
jgi:hypothetical protein